MGENKIPTSKNVISGNINLESLTVKGAIILNGESHPFELQIGTGRCRLSREDFEKLPEQEWRDAMKQELKKAGVTVRKEITFDFI